MVRIPDYIYQPSPSRILRQQGTVVEESFFLAEGQLVLLDENNTAIDCTFEVAYMQDGRAVAAVYLAFPDVLKGPDKYAAKNYIGEERTAKLSGQEVVLGRQITVDIESIVRRTLDSILNSQGSFILLNLHGYDVFFDDDTETDSCFFYITNLPIDPVYKPQKPLEYYYQKRKIKGSRYVLDKTIEFILESEESDKVALKEQALEFAKKTEENYPISEELFRVKYISLFYKDAEIARLVHIKSSEEISYQLEPVSRLRIYQSRIPEGWEVEQVADWICRLFSIALGIDIHWIHWHTASRDKNNPPAKHVWKSRSIESNRFTPFIINRYDANRVLDKPGLHENDDQWLYYYVEHCLENILEMKQQEEQEYYKIVLHYIHYVSIPSAVEVRTTLLALMAEYIFKVWSSHDIRQRRLKGTLREKLTRFFDFHEYVQKGGLWHYLEKNMELLINSRNALAHERKFYSSSEKNKSTQYSIEEEIYNAEMMIPLMISIVFGYEGRYWNSYRARLRRTSKEWGWTPKGQSLKIPERKRGTLIENED